MLLLNEKHITILKSCLEHFRKDLLWVIDTDEIINIDQKLGNELREVIGDELMKYGFNGDAPNSYGLLLEDLIDVIGDKFLK